MNRAKALLATIVLAAATVLALSSCATAPQKAKVNVLIVPKFELGHMAGDHVGEAQLFYEGYCAGCDEIKLAHATPTTHFFLNEDTGVGLLVTGAGKSAAALSLSSVLSCDDYDFSDTTIVSVGCAGGSTGTAVFGDVAIVTAACDNELGHHADSTELSDPANEHTWFPDDSYAEYDHEELNAELAERAWRLVRDCPLQTTERARQVLERNFPEQAWALRDPCVLKGTAVSGDSFWKGADGHRNAVYITEYHECPDPYAVCEMEEVAIMNAAECFGLEDRVISLRVVVNLDTFLEGESPEGLWASGDAFDSKVVELNSETVDIFDPAMHNLYDVTRIIIDALLANEL